DLRLAALDRVHPGELGEVALPGGPAGHALCRLRRRLRADLTAGRLDEAVPEPDVRLLVRSVSLNLLAPLLGSVVGRLPAATCQGLRGVAVLACVAGELLAGQLSRRPAHVEGVLQHVVPGPAFLYSLPNRSAHRNLSFIRGIAGKHIHRGLPASVQRGQSGALRATPLVPGRSWSAQAHGQPGSRGSPRGRQVRERPGAALGPGCLRLRLGRRLRTGRWCGYRGGYSRAAAAVRATDRPHGLGCRHRGGPLPSPTARGERDRAGGDQHDGRAGASRSHSYPFSWAVSATTQVVPLTKWKPMCVVISAPSAGVKSTTVTSSFGLVSVTGPEVPPSLTSVKLKPAVRLIQTNVWPPS